MWNKKLPVKGVQKSNFEEKRISFTLPYISPIVVGLLCCFLIQTKHTLNNIPKYDAKLPTQDLTFQAYDPYSKSINFTDLKFKKTYELAPHFSAEKIPKTKEPGIVHPYIVVGDIGSDAKIPSEETIRTHVKDNASYLVEYRNVFVTNEGVLIKDDTIYFAPACHNSFNDHIDHNQTIKQLDYRIYEHAIQIQHEYAWFYAHWMVDFLPNFYAIPQEILQKSYVLVIDKRSFVMSALRMVGVRDSRVHKIEAGHGAFCKHLYQVAPIMCVHFSANLLLNMREKIITKLGLDKNPPFRYVIYNRDDAEFRKMKNFKEVFKIVNETYPQFPWQNAVIGGEIESQVKLFNEFRLFVAVHGAAFSNTLFMQKDTAVAELQVERWVDNYLWISAFAQHYHIIARNTEIHWRDDGGKKELDSKVIVEMTEAGLRALGDIK